MLSQRNVSEGLGSETTWLVFAIMRLFVLVLLQFLLPTILVFASVFLQVMCMLQTVFPLWVISSSTMSCSDEYWNVLHTLNDFLLAYVQTVQDPVSNLISCYFSGFDTPKLLVITSVLTQFMTDFLSIFLR